MMTNCSHVDLTKISNNSECLYVHLETRRFTPGWQTYQETFSRPTPESFEMRTLFLVRCSMCRRMMPNFVDCFGYQSRSWTSPPQKYLQSLAFEVSTDTCPCPQLQHLLPPSPPPGNWFLLSSLPPPLPQLWDGNNGTLGGVASSS